MPGEYQDAPDCLCSRLRHRDCMAVTTGKFVFSFLCLSQKIRQMAVILVAETSVSDSAGTSARI